MIFAYVSHLSIAPLTDPQKILGSTRHHPQAARHDREAHARESEDEGPAGCDPVEISIFFEVE